MNDIETAISKYEKKKRREKYLLERGMSHEEIVALRKQKIAQYNARARQRAKEREEERTKGKKPYMTDREIADSYKRAVNQRKQIEILAQLNDVNRLAIESALERSGILKRKGDKFVRVY